MDLYKDTTFLLKSKLQQVSFGLYQVQLHFTNDIYIGVGNKISLRDAKQQYYFWDWTEGKRNVSFNSVLGEDIAEVIFSSMQDLELHFSNGEILTLFKGSDDAESYIVHHKKDFEVV